MQVDKNTAHIVTESLEYFGRVLLGVLVSTPGQLELVRLVFVDLLLVLMFLARTSRDIQQTIVATYIV